MTINPTANSNSNSNSTKNKLDIWPLWTAVVTPFTNDNNVDFESMSKLLRMQESAKNALLLLGSTGEALTLSLEEKKKVLENAISLKLKVPLMVGVGGINIEETVKWIDYLETIQIDCYLMVTPLYSKPGAIGQTEWFSRLLKRVSRPTMLYNIPGRTGCALNAKTLQQLESHPFFWSVKEASGSTAEFHNYRQATPTISYYSGDDGMMPFFALSGAVGLVSVASNVWPKATHKYVDLCRDGRFKDILPTWKIASDSLFTTSNPVPVKALLHELGYIKTPLMRPPLSHMDLDSREKLIKANEIIIEWERHNG
ncbi:MAG: 4-hydroxy-tetrahydrodipicolinate synthase [Oligoflexia bacterium]|nr:4-hydroxy-tetrahydrodipicolinate synthase [Oligoflexia bacterium]